MKGSKLYNINPALNQWEEEQYKKLMAKKIKGAKSTLAGHSGAKHAKPGGGRGANNRSSFPYRDSNSCGGHGSLCSNGNNSSTMGPPVCVAGTADVLLKIQALLQTPLLQQLVHQQQQQSCSMSGAALAAEGAAVQHAAQPAAGEAASEALASSQRAVSLQQTAAAALHGMYTGLHAPAAGIPQQKQLLAVTAQPPLLPVAATPEPATSSSPEPCAAPASRTAAVAPAGSLDAVSAGSISVTPEQLIWLASTATALLQGSNLGSIPVCGKPGAGLGVLQAGRPSSGSSGCQGAAAAGRGSNSGTAAGSRCSSRGAPRQVGQAGMHGSRVRSAAGKKQQQQQQQQQRPRPAWDEQWHRSDSSSTGGAANAAAGAAVTAPAAAAAVEAPHRGQSGRSKPAKQEQLVHRPARQAGQGLSDNGAAATTDTAVVGMRAQSSPGGAPGSGRSRQAVVPAAAPPPAAKPCGTAGRQGVGSNSNANSTGTSRCQVMSVKPPQPALAAAAMAASKRSSSAPGGTTDSNAPAVTAAAATAGSAATSLSEPGTCNPGVAAAVAAAKARLRSLSGAGSSSSSRGLLNAGSSCGGGSRRMLLHAAPNSAGSLSSGPSSTSSGAAGRYSNSDADDDAAGCFEYSEGNQQGRTEHAAILGCCIHAAACDPAGQVAAGPRSGSNSSTCCASQDGNTAAAAPPGQAALDVLATSLMQLNSMIQHKTQELSQQQQQQQHTLISHAMRPGTAAGMTVTGGPGTTVGPAAAAAAGPPAAAAAGLWSAPSELMGCSMQLQPSELLVLPMGGNPLLGTSDLAFLEQGQEAPESAAAAGCGGGGGCLLGEGGPCAVSKQQQSRAGSSCGGRSSVLSQQAASAAAAAAAAALEEDDMVLLGTLQGSFSMAGITQQLQLVAAGSSGEAAVGQPRHSCSEVRRQQQQQCVEQEAISADERPTDLTGTAQTSSAVVGGPRLGLIGQCGDGVVEVFEVREYGRASSECGDDGEGEVHSSCDCEVHGGGGEQGDEGYADDDWEDGEEPGEQQQQQLAAMGAHQDEQECWQQQQQQQELLQGSLELQQQAYLLEKGLVQLQLLVESRTQL